MAKLSLRNHPKFKLVKRDLNICDAYLLGHLEMLWQTAYENVGKSLPKFTIDEIEISADWQGNSGLFCESLFNRGFIDQIDDQYQIHNLLTHAPDYVKKRYNYYNSQRISENVRESRSYKPNQSNPIQSEPRQDKPIKNKDSSQQAVEQNEKVVFNRPYPLKNGESWYITAALYKTFNIAFDNVDRELDSAYSWLTANISKRKTKSGMPKFLNGWLARQREDTGNNDQTKPVFTPDQLDVFREIPTKKLSSEQKYALDWQFSSGSGWQPPGNYVHIE